MKSVSYEQLRGKDLTEDELSTCEPVIYNKDLKITNVAADGSPLTEDDIAFPCGIAARSYFNDTFVLQDSSENEITISSTNIAWSADKEYR
jgi:hypothetical protein